MKSEGGYLMLEMLVSLAVLLMIAAFLLPHSIIVIQDRKNIRLAQAAHIFLREQIVSYQFDAHPPASALQNINGTQYTAMWNEVGDAYSVCAIWKDTRNKPQSKCCYVAK
ncbi:type II secretion system GspH family protein [Ectobacillus funiculus]|uniref:hypothetical protein n=1 Tax=Ectobacillus funiculus TaxID=137993 RepID=UPI00397BE91A